MSKKDRKKSDVDRKRDKKAKTKDTNLVKKLKINRYKKGKTHDKNREKNKDFRNARRRQG